MAFGNTAVPTRKALNNSSGPTRPKRLRDLDSITAKRERLMSELARLRETCGPHKAIDNVQQLLTRWWSPASWHAREELLKTAEWFLQLEKTDSGEQVIHAAQFALGKPRR
jgi:hypothetical protein